MPPATWLVFIVPHHSPEPRTHWIQARDRYLRLGLCGSVEGSGRRKTRRTGLGGHCYLHLLSPLLSTALASKIVADVVWGAPWMALTWSIILHARPILLLPTGYYFCSAHALACIPVGYECSFIFLKLPFFPWLEDHLLAQIITDAVSGELCLLLPCHCPSSSPFWIWDRDFSLYWIFPGETGSQSLLSPPGTLFLSNVIF